MASSIADVSSNSGIQVRSGLHASGEPVLGRRRKEHNMYTTAIYTRQQLTNEGKCEFHTSEQKFKMSSAKRISNFDPHP